MCRACLGKPPDMHISAISSMPAEPPPTNAARNHHIETESIGHLLATLHYPSCRYPTPGNGVKQSVGVRKRCRAFADIALVFQIIISKVGGRAIESDSPIANQPIMNSSLAGELGRSVHHVGG